MEDLIEKRCGEIFLTIYGTTLFFCSLCENKYECYEDYAEHLNNLHIIVESKTLENDFETRFELETENVENEFDTENVENEFETENLEAFTEPLEELEIKCFVKEENSQITHFVECGDSVNALSDEEKYGNEIEVLEEVKFSNSIETIESITICPKSEVNNMEDDSSSDIVSDNEEEEFKKRPIAPTYIRSKVDESKFQCPYCEYATADKCNLRRHIDRHLKYKPYKCTECDKAFCTRSDLTTHIYSHTGERPFVCRICGFGFTTSSSRNKHMQRRHKNELLKIERDIKNNKSPKELNKNTGKARTKKDNTTKMKKLENTSNHEENILQVRTIKLRETTKERKHKCPHCPYASVTKTNLKTHMKRHFENKPFKCKLCENRFYTRNELNNHIQTHTGELPFLCTQCGMAFKSSCKLKTHLKRHEENRDKICSYCYKQFFDVKNLREHMLIHSEEMETSMC